MKWNFAFLRAKVIFLGWFALLHFRTNIFLGEKENMGICYCSLCSQNFRQTAKSWQMCKTIFLAWIKMDLLLPVQPNFSISDTWHAIKQNFAQSTARVDISEQFLNFECVVLLHFLRLKIDGNRGERRHELHRWIEKKFRVMNLLMWHIRV